MELIDRDELRKAMAPDRFDEQIDYEEAMRIIDEAPIFILPDEPPMLGFDVVDTTTGKYLKRVAKEYLEICGDDCAGDSSTGIPPCPFFHFPDVDSESQCELKSLLE